VNRKDLALPELDPTSRVVSEMLLPEALARARLAEAERAAQQYRLARRVAAARSWQRLAAWAARQATRANVLL
jgi:hypothetical protein